LSYRYPSVHVCYLPGGACFSFSEVPDFRKAKKHLTAVASGLSLCPPVLIFIDRHAGAPAQKKPTLRISFTTPPNFLFFMKLFAFNQNNSYIYHGKPKHSTMQSHLKPFVNSCKQLKPAKQLLQQAFQIFCGAMGRWGIMELPHIIAYEKNKKN